MNSTKIRKATALDLETIQKMSIQTFKETFANVNTPENIATYVKESFSVKQLTTELNNVNSQFYVAYLNAEAVGYLKINVGDAQTETFNRNALEVHRIYVLRKYHGKNIGQLLLDEAKNIAQHTGVECIWLGVWEENHRALRFYTKNGFVVFDKHVFTMGNDDQTDLLMQLVLHQ